MTQPASWATDWLARRESLSPNKVALIDTLNANRAITYREWNRTANRTANWLQTLGIRKGDRVAILATNEVAYLDLWFACGKLGAILQTLNWRLTPAELEGLIRDGEPGVLIVSPTFATTGAAILRGAGSQAGLFVLDETFRARRDAQSDAPPPDPGLCDSDPWVICYTGGTTGLPKGALLTHGSITANSVNTVMSWGLDAHDVAVLNAPLFHTGGLNVFTAPLVHCGATSIVCAGFEAGQVFDLIADAGVTVFFGVPTMFIALQQHERWAGADFSRLKIVISGGAACPLPVFEKFWARGVDFKTGYGLTEAGPNTFWLPREDVRRKPGAVGRPLFHVQTRIVDEHGAPCGPDEVGELLIRGPHVAGGYWRRPEETARAIDAAGWLRTGDLARCDAEGYYTIVGRSKDMIISGGENIYPAEVESVLHAHPAVAEAALVGVPDPKWGEVGRAFIVLQAGASADEESLRAFCAPRLARYKIPKSFVFVPGLPRTGAGKIDKKLLH
ncbi:MAG: long-chain fatty acid--CoA ligase [Thermoflexales bacterium]|nr:long-chain fatty acid--CoA ligase [Thermoflexales bacterium]